jgi:hypothetical protein
MKSQLARDQTLRPWTALVDVRPRPWSIDSLAKDQTVLVNGETRQRWVPTARTRRLLPVTDRRSNDQSSTPERENTRSAIEHNVLQPVIELCKEQRIRPVNRRLPGRLSLSDDCTPTSPTTPSFQPSPSSPSDHHRQANVNQPCSRTCPINGRSRLRKIFAANLGKSFRGKQARKRRRRPKAKVRSRSPSDYRAFSEPRYSAIPCAEVLVRSSALRLTPLFSGSLDTPCGRINIKSRACSMHLMA